jgi:glycerophosphoryl diester phosphodiesterase
MAAFQHALAIGVDLIECDLRRSADGVIILYHDERVDGEPVRSLTVRDLRQRVPTLLTLDDLLMLLAGRTDPSRLVLDLKERGIEQDLIPVLEQRPDVVRRALVTSVHTRSLRRLSERFPDLRLGLSRGHLISGFPSRAGQRLLALVLHRVYPWWMLPQVRWCRAGVVAMHYRLLNDRSVHRFQKMGCRVYAWTVDDCATAQDLARSGVDLIASNKPWELLGCLGRR